MYGMKAIYENLTGQNPQIMLRFGQNTLYLRPNAKSGQKPFCNHYAFVVENYDQATGSQAESAWHGPEARFQAGLVHHGPRRHAHGSGGTWAAGAHCKRLPRF